MRTYIEDIVAAMSWSSYGAYLNIKTGAVITINNDLKYALRKFEELPEDTSDEEVYKAFGWRWEYPEFLNFLRHKNQYLRLPDQYDTNEYHLIEDFIETVKDDEQRETLRAAVDGRGAFRRFKKAIRRYNIHGRWYNYKEKRLTKMAEEWCEKNDIAYTYRHQESAEEKRWRDPGR